MAPYGVPPAAPVFVMGEVAVDAPLSDARARWPVVLLSHGTGGTAASLGWLAGRLAAAGFIVLGVDHHGNTAAGPTGPRPSSPGGTGRVTSPSCSTWCGGRSVCRPPRPVGCVRRRLLHRGLHGAGARRRHHGDGAVPRWAATQPSVKGPREFPDIAAQVEPLLATSAAFRAAWERQSEDLRDRRISRVVALAPAPPVRGFREASLTGMAGVGVTIISGEADDESPWDPCALWLSRLIPAAGFTASGQPSRIILSLGRNEAWPPHVTGDLRRSARHRPAGGA